MSTQDYRLRGVELLAKARLQCSSSLISLVFTSLAELYGRFKPAPFKSGLKAVKLDMTRDQVSAFISRMSGLMVVTGAPGSGQDDSCFPTYPILYDQQGERLAEDGLVEYTPDLTRVFLANENLAGQAKNLLRDQLDIPASVVQPVNQFVAQYPGSSLGVQA